MELMQTTILGQKVFSGLIVMSGVTRKAEPLALTGWSCLRLFAYLSMAVSVWLSAYGL